ncbi:PQQ-binding-like beta-propeller repeat protein [Streptomyces lavendulocolor]|uniref:outer membrane protein assembly factor BamB family protein n=1 Tax=Streptomyces lavendulocolor TaxID=67316 RepID=UPI003C2E96C2
MPEDGQNVPKPGTPQRKQGRPQKDLSGQGAQREFAEVIRAEFFDRLARLGVTTAQISKALGDGFSGPSLSKFRAGERVPDRDKLLRLLAFAEEKADRPLPDAVREHVLEKYYAALRETNEQLHDFYRLLDEREDLLGERDAAREKQRRARGELVECQASLGRALRRVEELEAEARQAELEELRRQEREAAAENEAVRLEERHDQLERAVRQARAGQQAAHKEIRRLQNQLVQQTQESARSEAGLRETNAELAARVAEVTGRVAELEQSEQSLRAELDQVTVTLEQAKARNRELGSQHAVVLRSRAVVGQRLSQARHQRRDLEDKQFALKQREAAAMRELTAAQRRVADAESRLVAVYRSRDALLDDPSVPAQAVTEAEETVVAAWHSYEGEISRIEQHVVVSTGGTTSLGPGGRGESAGEAVTETAQGSLGTAESAVPAVSPPPARQASAASRVPDARARRRWPLQGMLTQRGKDYVRAWAGALLLFGAVIWLLSLLPWPGQGSDDGTKDYTFGEEDGPEASAGPTPKWALALPQPLDHRPALDGTVLVASAWHGATYGVDTRTGRRLWTAPAPAGLSRQPVVSGGLAHASAFGDLQTIDIRTGKVKWKKDDLFDLVTAANGILVAPDSKEVNALRQSDGKTLWRTELDAAASGRPALTKDTVYVPVHTGEIYALNAKTGTVKWRKSIAKDDDLGRGPVVAGNTVIVYSAKQVFALDVRSGKELWRQDYVLGNSDIVVASGLLLFIAKVEGGQVVTAADLKTGLRKWGELTTTTNEAQPLTVSAFADRVYVTYDSERLCAHGIVDGGLLGCFAGINTLPGTLATASGVYTTSHNQRLYYFPKEAFK